MEEKRFEIAKREFEKYASDMLFACPTLHIELDSTFDEGRRQVFADESAVRITAGSPIAVLYAVYDYFACYGAKWFWDGDVLPKRSIPRKLSFDTTPAYKLCGMRYFAHRGLKRFRAEMWGFEDWKKEIDYLIKNGFNFFMLRIGQDDLWQKAFPEICPYPSVDQKSDKSSFYDRSLFWSLEYRGELRKKVLEYADERGLKHAVDCGAVTHWYSPTPKSFIDGAKPRFLAQSGELYSQNDLLVFDVRNDKWLDAYMSLTDAEVKSYGGGDLFHTIGLAERVYGDTHEQSIALKTDVLKRTVRRINDKYPSAKTIIAGWDLSMFWRKDEVRALVSSLDSKKCIIFDYPTDIDEQDAGFRAWGLMGRFPYINGLIHAYAPQDDIRGDYDLIERQLAGTDSDEYCGGLLTWQELSHGDGIMLSYLAHKCTYGGENTTDEILCRYSDETFGIDAKARQMVRRLYDVSSLETFRLDRSHPEYDLHREFFVSVLQSEYGYNLDFDDYSDKERSRCEFYLPKFFKVMDAIPEVLSLASELYEKYASDAHARRALYDIARTAAARLMHFEMQVLQKAYFLSLDWQTPYEHISKALALYTELLGTHDDYIAFNTLESIRRENYVNRYFETTFKKSIASDYCIGNCFETLLAISMPQMDMLWHKLMGEKVSADEIYQRFFDTPLEEYSTKNRKNARYFAEICKNLCLVAKLAIDFNSRMM